MSLISNNKLSIQAGLPKVAVAVRAPSAHEAFLTACMNGEITTVRAMIDKMDIHKSDEYGCTALHHAAAGGHSKIIKLLIGKGAKIFARTRYGKTAVDLARSNPKCMKLFATHISKIDMETLALGNSRDGLNLGYKPFEILTRSVAAFSGIKGKYEGFNSYFTHQIIGNFFKHLTHQEQRDFISSEHQALVGNAFTYAAELKLGMNGAPNSDLEYLAAFKQQSDKLQLIQLIREGKPVVITTGFDPTPGKFGHVVDIVFFGKFMAICNRWDNPFPILIFEIDPGKVTLPRLAQLLRSNVSEKNRGQDIKNIYKKLYVTMPDQLSPNGRAAVIPPHLEAIFKDILPKEQKVSNCTATSAKAALLFTLVMLQYDPKLPLDQMIKRAKHIRNTQYKEATTRLREKLLAELPPGLDNALTAEVSAKIAAKAAKLMHS